MKIWFSVCLVIFFFLVSASSWSAVQAQGISKPERYYEIDEERLPLDLSLNSTRDDNTADDVVTTVQLSLSENKTNKTIEGVVYALELVALDENEETDSGSDSDRILTELFYAENGTLTLVLAQGDGPSEIQNGIREQFFNALTADGSADAPLTVRSDQIVENSTYELRVEILTVDDIRNILSPDDVPRMQFALDTESNNSYRVSVIPEFPMAAMIVIASFSMAMISTTLLSHRHRITN
jgi:hypothetical protein